MQVQNDFLVSVAVITYNQKDFITQALESVLMQKTKFRFEIVIGDDASTDGTTQILENYIYRHPNKVKLLKSVANLGPMQNVVRTYKACSGKYIAVLEGDDFWTDENKLQDQVNLMEENQNLSMCFTNRNIVDVNGSVIREKWVPPAYRRKLTCKEIITGFTPPTQTILFRKDLLDEELINNLKKVYNGDIYISSVLSTKGDVGYVDKITAAYRINSDGIYGKEDYFRRLKNQVKTYQVLLSSLDNTYRKDIQRTQIRVKQRLFVVSLLKGHLNYHLKMLINLFIHDVQTPDYSLIRAFKLLLTKGVIPSKVITD
ncbi:MAG: hypothetical protein DRI87_06915 [Bacteroidetes bacterium]|nr:MAG: hypothetical protein DRI87_06915 [Bacteroidota bacterium]